MAITYKDAGVDIDAGDLFVSKIKPYVKSTFRPEVLTDIGGFGGLFALKKYKNPVLVSGTDGVGTKLKIAFLTKKHDTVGIDLVAMCVNDIVVQGAEPLFFLDYFATGKLKPEEHADIVKGIAEGCRQSGCALIGGETAEMPSFYGKDEYDLAGFAVGVVEKKKIIDGSRIKPGDQLIGLASSGLHSNGYSLVAQGPAREAGYGVGRYPSRARPAARRGAAHADADLRKDHPGADEGIRHPRHGAYHRRRHHRKHAAHAPERRPGPHRQGYLGHPPHLQAPPEKSRRGRQRNVPRLQHGNRHGHGRSGETGGGGHESAPKLGEKAYLIGEIVKGKQIVKYRKRRVKSRKAAKCKVQNQRSHCHLPTLCIPNFVFSTLCTEVLMKKVKIGVLVSGRGSNLQAVIDNIETVHSPRRSPLSSAIRLTPIALERARKHDIPAVHVSAKGYKGKRDEYDALLVQELQKHSVELVVLAGFMRIITPTLIKAFPNRIMNIHPALLPAFPGLHVQKAALITASSSPAAPCTSWTRAWTPAPSSSRPWSRSWTTTPRTPFPHAS